MQSMNRCVRYNLLHHVMRGGQHEDGGSSHCGVQLVAARTGCSGSGRICCTGLAAAPDAPKFAPVAEASDYFGPVTIARWAGALAISDDSGPFELHWIEANYSDYDVELSRSKLADQGEFAAVLLLPEHSIPLLGKRRGHSHIQLVDTALIIEPDCMRKPWREFVECVKQLNLEGGMDTAAQRVLRLKSPDGLQIDLCLSENHAARLKLEQAKLAVLIEQAPTDAAAVCLTWIGAMRDLSDDILDFRVITLQSGQGKELARESNSNSPEPSTAASPMVAIVTSRFRNRRLEGDVPPGCPWQSRVSFAHTRQGMEAAQIDWYNGQFNEEASAIIQRATGATLTKEQFFSAIDATFGNRENAVRSCCALPEVMHMTFVSAPSAEGERFIGTERGMKSSTAA